MAKPKGAPEDPYCPFRERVNKLFDAIVNEVTTLGGLLYDEDYGDPNHFGVAVKVGQFKTIVRDAFRDTARECAKIAKGMDGKTVRDSWSPGADAACHEIADVILNRFGLEE